jgi:hypothetical protein
MSHAETADPGIPIESPRAVAKITIIRNTRRQEKSVMASPAMVSHRPKTLCMHCPRPAAIVFEHIHDASLCSQHNTGRGIRPKVTTEAVGIDVENSLRAGNECGFIYQGAQVKAFSNSSALMPSPITNTGLPVGVKVRVV